VDNKDEGGLQGAENQLAENLTSYRAIAVEGGEGGSSEGDISTYREGKKEDTASTNSQF